MKTKTNIRNSVIRSVALVVSLMLTVVTLEAKDLPVKNASKSQENETAFLVRSKNETRSVKANTAVSLQECTRKAFDPAAELESWMLNSKNFESADAPSKNDVAVPAVNCLQESDFRNEVPEEEPLALQEWMFSSRFWNL